MNKVGVLVFDNVEVLDFTGPFEVLSVAAGQSPGLLTIEIVGTSPEVVCRGGLVVRPSRLVSDNPVYNTLVVPGGPGARSLVTQAREHDPVTQAPTVSQTLLRYIAGHAERGALVASVCTGAYFLAEAGLLAGRKATTHHAAFRHFSETYPGIQLVTERFVDEGPVITSGGVSCGIDMALHLVDRLIGSAAARIVADVLEWPGPG